jgi:protein gp37
VKHDAAVRFISVEPMLGPVNLRLPDHFKDTPSYRRLNWVIAGGESGFNARPVQPAWLHQLRGQCHHWDIPFLFKQWGEWVGGKFQVDGDLVTFFSASRDLDVQLKCDSVFSKSTEIKNDLFWFYDDKAPDGPGAVKIGKKHAGRQLGWVTYDQFPTSVYEVDR